MKIGQLVLVKWGDAYEHIGNNYRLSYKKSLTCTVGYIADICKHRVYISMFKCGIAKKLTSPYVAIPVKMIHKVVRLKHGK